MEGENLVKGIIILMAFAMFAVCSVGCTAYVRYPSIGVGGQLRLHTHAPYQRCRWVYQDGGRFKECLGPRGWEYRR